MSNLPKNDAEWIDKFAGFGEGKLVDAVFLLGIAIGRKRYPEISARSEREAALRFFQDFTKAGEDVILNGYKVSMRDRLNSLTNDELEALREVTNCDNPEECEKYEAFEVAAYASADIIGATHDAAKALLPDELAKNERDVFLFSQAFLLSLVESAAGVVEDWDNAN